MAAPCSLSRLRSGDGRQLVAVQRLSEIRAAQTGVLALAGGVLLLALVVAWFVGGWIARRLTAPLVRLEAGAERIAAGEFGATVPRRVMPRRSSLARSFNRMSERVALAYDAQRSFVGDVSHEIRTPLTSISGFAGALLDGTISDPAAQERALGVIRDEARRIQDLSDTLLALAQLDAGAVELAREPVDMQALATALHSRFEAPASSHQVSLEVSLAEARAAGRRSGATAPGRLHAGVERACLRAAGRARRGLVAVGGRALAHLVDDDGPASLPRSARRSSNASPDSMSRARPRAGGRDSVWPSARG